MASMFRLPQVTPMIMLHYMTKGIFADVLEVTTHLTLKQPYNQQLGNNPIKTTLKQP